MNIEEYTKEVNRLLDLIRNVSKDASYSSKMGADLNAKFLGIDGDKGKPLLNNYEKLLKLRDKAKGPKQKKLISDAVDKATKLYAKVQDLDAKKATRDLDYGESKSVTVDDGYGKSVPPKLVGGGTTGLLDDTGSIIDDGLTRPTSMLDSGDFTDDFEFDPRGEVSDGLRFEEEPKLSKIAGKGPTAHKADQLKDAGYVTSKSGQSPTALKKIPMSSRALGGPVRGASMDSYPSAGLGRASPQNNMLPPKPMTPPPALSRTPDGMSRIWKDTDLKQMGPTGTSVLGNTPGSWKEIPTSEISQHVKPTRDAGPPSDPVKYRSAGGPWTDSVVPEPRAGATLGMLGTMQNTIEEADKIRNAPPTSPMKEIFERRTTPTGMIGSNADMVGETDLRPRLSPGGLKGAGMGLTEYVDPIKPQASAKPAIPTPAESSASAYAKRMGRQPTRPSGGNLSQPSIRNKKEYTKADIQKLAKNAGKVLGKGLLAGIPLMALDYFKPDNAIAQSRDAGYGLLKDMGVDVRGGIDSIENDYLRIGASIADGLLVDMPATIAGAAYRRDKSRIKSGSKIRKGRSGYRPGML